MTETHAIIDAYRRAAADHLRAALATVVRVEGSSYRQPGARMLITETGATTGMVSGGCLEGDVRERAAAVMRTGQPACVAYDATADNDILWGLGSGCHGVVHVLIEPAGTRVARLVQFLDACAGGRRRSAFATVIRSSEPALPLGTRIFRGQDDVVTSDPTPPARIASQILTDITTAVRSGISRVTHYGDEDVDAFVEVVEPRVPLVVFGNGADVAPLVAIARSLGWHTTVVDTHAHATSRERFAQAETVLLCRPEDVAHRVALDESTVAVLMTHNYLHDLDVLRVLLDRRVRYVGCLGPKRRTERLLSQLWPAGVDPSAPSLVQLHAPVGMDIGAEAPPEIALSIAAEILTVLRDRPGGPLHRRHGPIHDHAAVRDAGRRWTPPAECGEVLRCDIASRG